MLHGKARKGSIVEINRKIGPGKDKGGFSPGQFGKVVRARKHYGYDGYKYELKIDDGRYYWFDERALNKGRHSVRYRDKEGVWRCEACQRKVKAPPPCPTCGEYVLEFHATRTRPAWGKPQLLNTYEGQRVCHPCISRLPRENKTDWRGNALALGDTVQIVGTPLDYLGFMGKRATVRRRGAKHLTIEFADGKRYYWDYRSVAKTEDEPTESGRTDIGLTKRLNEAFGAAIGKEHKR